MTQLFAALHAPRLHSLMVCIIDDPNSIVDYPALMDAIAHAVCSDARSLVLEIYMQHYIPRAPRPANSARPRQLGHSALPPPLPRHQHRARAQRPSCLH